jgi:hypothetical protein
MEEGQKFEGIIGELKLLAVLLRGTTDEDIYV